MTKSLEHNWKALIQDFEASYRALDISITIKVHNVFYETIIYIEKFEIPLGIHSEHKFEVIHKDLRSTWLRYKRAENHPDYGMMMKSAMANYNAFHTVPGCNKKS